MLCVTMLCATAAAAQPAYPPVYGGPPPAAAAPVEKDGPFLFAAGHLALNAPFGALGLEAGGGFGFVRGSVSIGRGFRGVSVAAMGRVVHDVGAIGLGLGVGMSRGPGLHSLGPTDGSDYETHYGDETIWLDIEMSAEAALAGSGFMRLYAGVTGAQSIDCVSEHRRTDARTVCDGIQVVDLRNDGYLPYVGIAGGFRWPAPPASKPRYTPPPSPYPTLFPPPPRW